MTRQHSFRGMCNICSDIIAWNEGKSTVNQCSIKFKLISETGQWDVNPQTTCDTWQCRSMTAQVSGVTWASWRLKSSFVFPVCLGVHQRKKYVTGPLLGESNADPGGFHAMTSPWYLQPGIHITDPLYLIRNLLSGTYFVNFHGLGKRISWPNNREYGKMFLRDVQI